MRRPVSHSLWISIPTARAGRRQGREPCWENLVESLRYVNGLFLDVGMIDGYNPEIPNTHLGNLL
jgi:hypothetical protein